MRVPACALPSNNGPHGLTRTGEHILAGWFGRPVRLAVFTVGCALLHGPLCSAQAPLAAVATVANGLKESVTTDDFGVDRTGATNTTAKLLAFYNYCIAKGARGRILQGTYKVTPGVLVFNCNQADLAWPDIETAGYFNTVFKVDPATKANAPVLTWTNGTPTSYKVSAWRGGSHGGLTILDGSGDLAPLRSGISMQGMYQQKFGHLKFQGLPGDGIIIPMAAFKADPDPCACSFLDFDQIEAVKCAGYALNNRNGLGKDSWKIHGLVATQCGLGGIYGEGSGCWYGDLSGDGGHGWFYDDGTLQGAPLGNPQRNVIEVAEMDNWEYGIRLNKTSFSNFQRLRFVHRFHADAKVYWPRVAVDLCPAGAVDPNINNVVMQVFHRIEPGGPLAALGVFTNANGNGNIRAFNLDVTFADSGHLGVADGMLFTGFSHASVARITSFTKCLFESSDKAVSFAVGSKATIIPRSGFGGTQAVVFDTQMFPTYSTPYSIKTSTFTVPRRGLYRLSVSLPMGLPVGTRVRLGFKTPKGICGATTGYQVAAGLQTYSSEAVAVLEVGDVIYVTADQSSTAPAYAAPAFSNDECRFFITEM